MINVDTMTNDIRHAVEKAIAPKKDERRRTV